MSDDSKDAKKDKPQLTQGEQLANALGWVLDKASFAEIKLHGSIKWAVPHLVRVAILWVWSDKRLLVDSADDAIAKTKEICGSDGINSYQVLINALIKYGKDTLACVSSRMHQLMEQVDETKFRIGIWLVLAVDGSRLDTPRTQANEARFCKPRNSTKNKKGKKKNKRGRHAQKRAPVSKKAHYNPQPVGPQVWLTLLWHVAMGMPWAWKIGPSYSSERDHLLEMLESVHFPKNTMICGDAGFVGYEFWKAIDSAGHRFLCRVGGNCTFLKLLGNVRQRHGIVYCWPQDQQKKGCPPLTLRLLCFNDGRGQVYLVTNELDTRKLSDKVAGEIYRNRWGIEVQFRTLKQTYDRSKLQGRTPDVAEVELSWSILGLWIAQLFALKEQAPTIHPDAKTSVAQVLRIIQSILQRPDLVPVRGASFKARMSKACTDTYTRTSKKKSRNYPRRKEEPRTGPPKIVIATKQQRSRMNDIQAMENAA